MGAAELQVFFGLVIRRARCAAKKTQAELADLADLDRTYISGLERGRTNPTLAVQDRLARSLGVPLSQLIKDAEELRRAV